MKNSVGVVIPVFNRQNLVIRALESVLHQTVKPAELIVVDNNSTDSSYETVKSWMEKNQDCGIRFKLLKEERRGACNARQKGLENTDSEYIIFFDSDDEMLPD